MQTGTMVTENPKTHLEGLLRRTDSQNERFAGVLKRLINLSDRLQLDDPTPIKEDNQNNSAPFNDGSLLYFFNLLESQQFNIDKLESVVSKLERII